jgi:hypothetical protein
VLVVEPSDTLCNALSDYLTSWNLQVVIKHSFLEIIKTMEKSEKAPYQVALIDLDEVSTLRDV